MCGDRTSVQAQSRQPAAAARVTGGAGKDGGEAADPDGQREAQQEHHAARERGQDLEERTRGEGVGGALAVGAVHLRGVRIGYLPDYSEYQDGHVKELIFKQDGYISP